MIKVLMTGAGAPGGPGIIRCLSESGKIELYTADADPEASGRFLSNNFHIIPRASDPSFINHILDFCVSNGIQAVFPLVTRELFKFAENKSLFEANNIKVIVSDEFGLYIANDKGKLYTHLEFNNILVPNYRIVSTVDDFEKAVYQLGYPEVEICFKPTISNGSKGFRVISEQVDEFNLLFNYKPNSTYIKLETLLPILRRGNIPQLLVSEYLPGEEYTVDTIVNRGKPLLILPRLREKMIGGISVKGQFVENREIIEYSSKVISSMDLHGPIGIQVKKGSDGHFKILEINPRIQGTSVSAMGLGINLPLIAVLQEFEDISGLLPKQINWGTKFVRYWNELFY